MHKAFKVLLWFIFSAVMFFILLAAALQITAVQNWAVDKVTSYLNARSNFHTEIGRIKITWWDAVELQHVTIRDHKDSLMLGAESLMADFQLSALFPPGNSVIEHIALDRGQVYLVTHPGDSSMNINIWIREISQIFGSSSGGKSTLAISSVDLRQTEVFLLNLNTDPILGGLDYNNLRFSDIKARTENFYLDGSEIGIDIRSLTGVERSSGIPITELRTKLSYSREFLEFDKLSLKTKNSHIKNFLRFEYASPLAFSNFLDAVVIIANMDETKLDLGDLKLFAPQLPDIDDEIYLSGKVVGPVSDLKSDEFLIRLGEKTALFGAFELDGLPDLKKTYLNLSLKNSTILANDLAPYISEELEKEIRKFNTIRLNADFAGYLNRFTTNGSFTTSIGNLNGRVNYDEVNGVRKIVSKVSVRNLDLGVLAENRALFQKISLDGNVNIQGSSRENALIDVDATVSQIGVNSYNYSNIRTDATYGLDLFKGSLSINDPNLKMDAAGSLDLRGDIDSVRMNINLDTAFLDNLKLTEKPTFISGNLNIDTRGIRLDDIQGIARFRNLTIGYEDRSLEVGDFFFQSLFAGGTRTMSLNSDYLVAAASGQFNLEQMSDDLTILADQYLSIILNEPQPIADLENNFSETYNLDLNLRLIDINPIIQLFDPDWKISNNTVLEGAFYQTPENTIFNFFTSIDTLSYRGSTAFNTNIDFNTSKIINSEEILASFYVFSKAQNMGQKLQFTNLGFEAIWDRNEMDVDFTLEQDSTQSAARINATTRFSSQNTTISFNPSYLKVLNRDWQFDSLNQITIRPEEINFTNVKLFNENQFISLEGKTGTDPEDKLDLTVHKVNIDILNTLLPQNYDGMADGIISFEKQDGIPALNGNMTLKDLEINKFPVGNVTMNANLNNQILSLNLENIINGQKTIDVAGVIETEEKALDLNARIREADLVILQPFLSNYLSDMGGTVTGDIKINGTTSVPELAGRGRVNQGRLRINYLNTSYQLNGNLLFTPEHINFQELVLRDVHGSQATLSGGVTHKGFNNIFLDITSRLSNFQVLNTTDVDNDVFYGSAFVSGNLEIKGTTSNLDINARATSQPNTRIYIPLSSNTTQSQEDFINLINIRDTLRIQQIADDVNRLELENTRMNFTLDITPDTYAEIIIDPRTEEGISGRGRGVLTMNIDTQGNFTLNGTYEITEGKYNFSLYNVLKKEFNVRPGGRISWYGNPYEGIMDLTAEYSEAVSIQPLLATTSVTDNENSLARRRYPVKVIMDLKGELLSPSINFGFDFSEFPSSGDVQTTISAFQNRVANNEQEMNRQVFSVIMTRSFSPEGQFSGVANISSSLGQLLSSQLNSFLGQVDKNLEIDVDLASLDANTLETFQLSVAYTFLNGRLRVSRDGGFTDNRGNADAASIIGDWQAEYLLTQDGVYRMRIFNRNNFNMFTSLSLSKNVNTYGVALSQNISFNSFSELFKKLTRRQDEEEIRIESEKESQNPEDGEWLPIDLDNLEIKLDSLQKISPAKNPGFNKF